MDFSGIKFDVYSAEQVSSSNKILEQYYEESYEFSVVSDATGRVEFERPSGYFSVSIDIESLPEGFGVVKHTEFYLPNTNNSYFELKEICDFLSFSNALDTITEFVPISEDNETLFATISSKLQISESDYIDVVMGNNEINIPYKVVSGTFEKYISVQIDISDVNKIDRIKHLSEQGFLSEEEKINNYCDIILQRSFEGISCIEAVFDEIWRYSLNKSQCSETLNTKIQKIFEHPLTTQSKNRPEYAKTFASANFIIYYDGVECTDAEARLISSYMETLRTTYITMGFSTPILESSSTKYNVYLTTNESENSPGTLAVTVKSEYNDNKCASYIVVYNFYEITDLVKETLGHEYFHAIQNAYNHTSGWFKEACATWGAMSTTGLSEIADGWLEYYLKYNNTSSALTSRDGYECFFIPLCIEKEYGGVSTMVDFYEMYENCEANCSDIVLFNTITLTLQNNGYVTSTFDDVYEKCVVFNAYPYEYYSTVYENEIQNSFPQKMLPSVNNYTDVTRTINSYGSLYYNFLPANNAYSVLSITIDASNSNAKCKYIRATASEQLYDYDLSPSSSRFTVVHNTFGYSTAKEYTVIAYNTNPSSSCNVTVSATKTINRVDVEFDPNGGICSQSSKRVKIGENYGALPIPTREGYTFVGWWPSETSETYEVTYSSIVTRNTHHTLYAHWAKTYKITNIGSNKCLNIHGDDVTTLSNGINITLWSDSGTNEQKWLVSELGTEVYIRSVIDQLYGLNVYRSGNPYNCNVYEVIGNEMDAQIDIIQAGTGTYKIKLHNYDLYLTVGSSANGANVYWSPNNGSSYQLWSFTLLD